jgi:c-di-GMP-binding flagellar brake protein YcgR
MSKEAVAVAVAENQRQYMRVSPPPGAPIRVDINGNGFIEVIKAMDISEGGIRIIVPHRFEGCHTEEPVSLIICLPHPINKQFRVKGKIKHATQDSFGVHFIDLNDKSRAEIRRYISMEIKNHSFWDYMLYSLGMLR